MQNHLSFPERRRSFPHSLRPDVGARGDAALLHGSGPRPVQQTGTHQSLEDLPHL